MPVTRHQMIVHHSRRLHEGVNDRRPAKLEAALLQLLRDFLRERCLGGNLFPVAETVDLRFAVYKVPEEFREARALFHDLQIRLRRQHCAFDLHPVPYDAGILHQRLDLLLVVARDFFGLKIRESAPEILALP